MNAKAVYYIIQFLEGMGMGSFYPIYTPWLELHGLNFLKMGYVNFLYHITAAILDPFTGFVADKLGKRKTFIVGQLLWTITQYIYGASSNITGFFMAESIAAIGHSLKSDALESWLQNKLGKQESTRTVAKAKTVFTIGQIITGILAGYISANYGMQIAWFTSGSLFLLATVIGSVTLISAGDDLPHENAKTLKDEETTLKHIFSLVISNKKILSTALLIAASSFASKPLFMYWPKIVEILGMPEAIRGWTVLAMSLPIMAGSLIAGPNKILKHNKQGILNTLVLLLLGLTSVALAKTLPVFFIGLSLVEFSYGALGVLVYANLYDEIHKEHRSTINSIVGSIRTLGGAASLLIMGAISDVGTPQTAIAFGGAFILVVLIYQYRLKEV